MHKLFSFENSDLFDFNAEVKLFHFLEESSGGDIVISTPHLTDEQPATPSGDSGSFALGGNISSGSIGSPRPAASTTSSSGAPVEDTFLKNLASQKQKNNDSDLVLQALAQSEGKNVEKKKAILGELPKIDTSLFIDREFHLKKQLSFMKILFASLVTLGFIFYVFFFTQLNPNVTLFSNQNVGVKLKSTSDSLKSVMTELNFNRYRTAKEYLDQFFYKSNEYLRVYDAWRAADDSKKADLAADLEKAKNDLVKPFEQARAIMAKPNFARIYREQPLVQDTTGMDDKTIKANEEKLATAEFNGLLLDSVTEKKRVATEELKNLTSTNRELKKQEIRDLDELMQLIGNDQLMQLISTDIKKMPHDQLRKHIIKLSSKYNNRLAFIFQIKDKRIPWAVLIKEIYTKTEASDDRFKTKLYKDIGGILYTGFDFDGSTGRLTISGNVKDFKGENFKILAILIDQLEGSTRFKDVEMRNFSKTFSEKDGFEGNFKIDLSLQADGEVDDRDKVIDLSQDAQFFGNSTTTDAVLKKISDAPVIPKP
ncbi:MAG: hypothetical protein NTX63_05120 [Candidatus Peregrinibacteria bacterium]|nr:hypothetical protein [Candidatus Peregrinibacteria bacterium]